jgi:hypothetical protein
VLVNRADATRFGLAHGDRVVLRSDAGQYPGRIQIAQLAPGNL